MFFYLLLLLHATLAQLFNYPRSDVPQYNLSPSEKLEFVQVVWRHGDRAPVGTYPTDHWQEDAWPNGWGELTSLGMRQQYALGRVLKGRYINESGMFLSERYAAKEIYIRSTDVNRTLLSAYSNLAGMFPLGKRGIDFPSYGKWPEHWTPIPVHTVDWDTDHIGNIFAACARADELSEALYNSSSYKRLEAENERFLAYISDKTGMKVDLKNVYLINDVHYIETLYNLSQPTWLTQQISTQLQNLTTKANEYTYGIGKPYVPELIRLRGGNLLKAMVENMIAKTNCNAKNNAGEECIWLRKLKYYAYSAHDTTVAAFLTTLGNEQEIIRGGLPKYTASVAVELWTLKSGPAVRLMYHSAFHHNYHPITQLVRGCPDDSEFCSLKKFIERSTKFMPTDINDECKHGAPPGTFKINQTWLNNLV